MNDLARGEVPSWKEYSLENKEVQDWVVWEALTHESVLRSKDDSVLGVIRYKPFERKEGAGISLPAFSQGWVMNIEEQYGEAGEACFLTLTWNPFLSLKGDKVENALGENAAMSLDAMEQHMFSVLDTLASRFPPEAEARILKYQEIIDYLAFSLSHGRLYVEIPDVPVDLDVYLTQDFTADSSALWKRRFGASSRKWNTHIFRAATSSASSFSTRRKRERRWSGATAWGCGAGQGNTSRS